MPQSTLVIDFTILLAAAVAGGMFAHRLRQPVVLGYLVVGIAVGPHALGLVRDLPTVEAAATIGVTLLMLTLGLEVSFAQLRQVGRVGLWGGIAQILLTVALGTGATMVFFQWSWPEAALFGLIISLSSTMVCLKILMDRGELDSIHGRIMIALLILQDISVVLMIVIVPILGQTGTSPFPSLAIALRNSALFVLIVIVAGVWILPWLMGRVGGVRSRELFLLTVLVISLGAVLGTQVLGLPVVFGAFLIGLVLRKTRFAHRALAEVTPLRDIFAALFFVSLGMLLEPEFVIANWSLLSITVGLIIVIKFLTVFGILRSFGYSGGIALMASAGLFQIGEFGFILAEGGINMGIISPQFYYLVIGSAIITMLLTPLSMSIAARLYGRVAQPFQKKPLETIADSWRHGSAGLASDVVIAGFGRVGQNVARSLEDAGISYRVIEIDPEVALKVPGGETACIYGDASNAHVLSRIDLTKIKVLVVTFPDPIAVLTTVKTALGIHPKLKIVARVHRTREAEVLRKMGVLDLISPEYEASLEFLRRVLIAVGRGKGEIGKIMTTVLQDKEVTEFATDDQEG